jgi:glycosyltransferase involved in cell wall biosynthesis
MSPPLRVLHVIPSFYPATRYGGPIESVFRLCAALPSAGVHVDVVTTNADGPCDLDVPVDRATSYEGVPVRYFQRRPRTGFCVSPGLVRHLAVQRGRYDLWHVTGLFSFPSTAAALLARGARAPYVMSPRGTLRPWSLHHRSWKKEPYYRLLERGNLTRAAALHATSEAERAEIEALAPGAEVFFVPNGVDLPPPVDAPREERRVVFLGRLHPVKGFDVLLPALERLAARLPGVETVLAGPDDHGLWKEIQEKLSSMSPRPAVRYVGPVRGDDKARLLASASVLVLPSHSENFGQVVLEAMAAGAPVVVSRNCPWRSVEERGAGAWVVNEPAAVADALEAILRDPAGAREMGRRGRALAAEHAWPAVAARMAERYASVASRPSGRREMP